MRILLSGASGMLATDVIPMLIHQGHEVVSVDLYQRKPHIIELDVANKDAVFRKVSEVNPDYFFHLAAETNVDYCEENPEHAFRINTIGTENVALACQKFHKKMLYISTAGVFQGDKKEPYTEFDTPNPVNIYGESKLQGEYIVKYLLNEYFIVRAGWMVGGWEIDKKFVFKIVQQLLEGKKELKVVSDKWGTPTFTKDFAANLMTIIDSNRYGLFHLVNKGTCSRYDIALRIVEFMDLKDEVKVEAISSDQFPLPAPRANSEMMLNYKLDLLNLNQMPHWESSLRHYIETNVNART